MNKETKLFIYKAPSSCLDEEEISKYLENLLDINCIIRPSILEKIEDIDCFATESARARVRDIGEELGDVDPNFGEKRFEKKLINEPHRDVKGVLYDGKRLMRSFFELIDEEERLEKFIHLICTNRLFGTFGEDGRYHARVVLMGYPSFFSLTGLIEAPAKPKEFYRKKRHSNKSIKAIKEDLESDFLDYGEERLTEAAKGYFLQIVFYHLGYRFFCDKENCRFYNAHWQSEVIEAQLGKTSFCEEHMELVDEVRELS